MQQTKTSTREKCDRISLMFQREKQQRFPSIIFWGNVILMVLGHAGILDKFLWTINAPHFSVLLVNILTLSSLSVFGFLVVFWIRNKRTVSTPKIILALLVTIILTPLVGTAVRIRINHAHPEGPAVVVCQEGTFLYYLDKDCRTPPPNHLLGIPGAWND